MRHLNGTTHGPRNGTQRTSCCEGRTATEGGTLTESEANPGEEDLVAYTPGPWDVVFTPQGDDEPPNEAIIVAPERRDEGSVIALIDEEMIDWEKNAYLIATVPDLVLVVLEALKAQPCQIDTTNSAERWETMAWAAFRKAQLPGMERPGGCYHCMAEKVLALVG